MTAGMRRVFLAPMIIAALFLAVPAGANVRVSYTVDDKAVKAAVAGTALTFQLYSDSGCTSAVGAPVNVMAENVELIERLKRFHVAGAASPPRTDRLTHVLAGAAPPVAFLTVTGTGITPVGGACQLQLSGGGAGIPCLSQVGTEVYFTGCNVNIQSG